MKFPTIDKFAKEVAEKALDEITYEGKTIREWAELLVKQQPCEDCISREEVRRILGNEVFELMKLHTVNPEDNPKADAMAYGVNWSLNTLMELTSVIPERPKGEWIEYEVDVAPHPLHCSLCGFSNHHISNRYMREFRRCPDCGADMSGGGEDDLKT